VKKYYTTLGGFIVYKNGEADLSKLMDCIIVKGKYVPNAMIVDHVPDLSDAAGQRAIDNVFHTTFKLISSNEPCAACKNAYRCMFNNSAPLSDCIDACRPLLKKQTPFRGFTYVKSGYTVDPFCTPTLMSISLCESFISMRTKEICKTASRGCYTRKFRKEHCTGCVYDCTYVPRKTGGKPGKCKLTQETLYSVLDKEVELRFGSYDTLMSMSANCNSILRIGRRKYVVACPVSSKYYLLRRISKPFTLKLLESKYLGTKTATCSENHIAKLRTMVAYQNSVNMFMDCSNDWRVSFGGYILPMAFADTDAEESDLTVYCKQPTMRGRVSYYRNPEEVIRIQYHGNNWGLNILYPFNSRKATVQTLSNAVRGTKDFSKNPGKYLQTWDHHSSKYKPLEIVNNSEIKQGGKLQW